MAARKPQDSFSPGTVQLAVPTLRAFECGLKAGAAKLILRSLSTLNLGFNTFRDNVHDILSVQVMS